MKFKMGFFLSPLTLALITTTVVSGESLLGTPNIRKVAQVENEFYLSDGNSFRYLLRFEKGTSPTFHSISDRTILSVTDDRSSRESALLTLFDNSTQPVLELLKSGKKTEFEIPENVTKLMKGNPPPYLFMDSGKVIMVFRRHYAVLDHGRWSIQSLEPVPGDLSFPETTVWNKGKLIICRHGGEWGKVLLEFDSGTRHWRKLFDNLQTGRAFDFSVINGHVFIISDGRLAELANNGTLSVVNNSPPNLLRIYADRDKTAICTSSSGQVFGLETLKIGKTKCSANFREISSLKNQSVQILGVCSDYALMYAENKFSLLDLHTGATIIPIGPV